MNAKIGVSVAALLATFTLLVTLAVFTNAHAAGGKIAVVAAENFYGDVAQQIGGDQVAVVSIMSNPDQDPHLFETSPAVVRQIAAAQSRHLQRRRLRPLDGQAAHGRRRNPDVA